MLATLGIVIQGYNTKIIPGFPVTETNEIEALKRVYYEAPQALFQVRFLIKMLTFSFYVFMIFSTNLIKLLMIILSDSSCYSCR
jgi:hypothetical protein